MSMLKRVAFWIVLVLAAALLFAIVRVLLRDDRVATAPVAQTGGATVAEAMAGDTAGFARVLGPRPFTFPDDHGPHPEFRTEWWYFTGNLDGAGGRRFGYQLTIFRNATAPVTPESPSAWATNQVYMAHFAVTDGATPRFHAFERFARGAVGLAGAQIQPFRVWHEDWEIRAAHITGPGDPTGLFPLRLQARQDGIAIELDVMAGKPIVLQGDAGYSRKGPQPGDASHYYSFTRLPTTGRVTIDGLTLDVTGLSWLDREWSTSALGEDQEGWDWFALQLDDNTELMLYMLRLRDGTPDVFSRGVFVHGNGDATHFPAADLTLEVTRHWPSPRGGHYPAGWRLTVPGLDLLLEIAPIMADQEHDAYVRYWEGAVDVRGRRAGRPVEGRGYVELTGYAPTAR
jgi:predicted secreted hydrolase